MPQFRIVGSANEISLSKEWIDADKFQSKERIVDINGKEVSQEFAGHKYQLVAKKARSFSLLERIGRVVLGVLAIIFSIGFARKNKSVNKLLTKKHEAMRFAILVLPTSPRTASAPTPPQPTASSASKEVSKPPTKAVNDEKEFQLSKRQLQEGMAISETALSDIQRLMNDILDRKKTTGIKHYEAQWKHRVFSLDSAPGIIFKMKASDRDYSVQARYNRMIQAQTVCRTHQLDLLVIPKASLFTIEHNGEKIDIIAEQKLDINPEASAQEQYFQDYAESLNKAIRQLAYFICNPGYSDVEWRNNPVLNQSLDEKGNRKIALIDIERIDEEEPDEIHIGLYGGGLGRRGLVGCVNEAQAEIVKEVAKQEGQFDFWRFAGAVNKRKKELDYDKNLKQYYASKKITVGDEPIVVDEKELTFAAFPKKSEEVKQFAIKLIKAMNEQIAQSSPEKSIRGRRYIYINTNKEPFADDTRLIEPGENARKTANAFKTDEEYYNATFLGCVVKKLEELGAIFKLINRNGHGYYMQA